ncbi:MAG: ATP-binding protein [Deltaproteobacteria bacterium]|nr:ATP-binding protein [Deltaproteobacteria bacterium]
MIPESLGGWTLDAIRELLSQGAFESDRFDFKEMLPHPDDAGGKARLVQTCAAFANASGGFLIFGVRDDRELALTDRLVGVDSTLELPEHFGSFPAQAEPSVEWTFLNPPLPLDSGKVVHVVHVPESKRKPHGVRDNNGRLWFCRRTNRGTEPMSYDEVRLSFLEAGRKRQDLLWLKAEVARILEVAKHLNILAHANVPDTDVLLTRIDVAQIKTAIVPLFGEIGGDPLLVNELHLLIEHGSRLDTALAPLAAFALMPRDRSYSGTRTSPKSLIAEIAPQVVIAAEHVLQRLKAVSP